MNNFQIFQNSEFGQIRTCTVNGETYFAGKDVASALGYKNTRDAVVKHVEEEDKTTVAICDGGSSYKSRATFINESGLYSLVLSSKLESARRFKHWVTSEVLPAIRKHGYYQLEQYARTVLASEQTVTITQIAQDYGYGPVRFNRLLADLRIQHKVGGQWILYLPYLDKGYVQSFSSYFVKPDGEVQVKLHTRWTQSGRLFLYNELKRAGVRPIIEEVA